MSVGGGAAALERASGGDLAELERLGSAQLRSPSAAELERELLAGRLLVLRGPRGLVAWCCLRVVADELQIEDLVVAAARRREGWGRRLLSLVLELARQRGAATAHLEVRRSNLPARSLYRSAGFVEVGERRDYYREPPDDAVLMRRMLAREADC